MSCLRHLWQPLFPPPDRAAVVGSGGAVWLGILLHGKDSYTICSSCGCLGSVRRGWSRGGVHMTRPIAGSAESHDRLRAEAARWEAIRTHG